MKEATDRAQTECPLLANRRKMTRKPVSTSAGKGMSWNGAGEKALEDEEEAI